MIKPMIASTPDYSDKLPYSTSVSVKVQDIVTPMTADIAVEIALPYLTAEEYPILAEIWDNEFDAIYDSL